MGRKKVDPALTAARGGFRKNPKRAPAKSKAAAEGAQLEAAGRDYAAVVARYVADVLSGAIPACKWVKAAVQRHRDDLARQDDPAYPYRFDQARADKALSFIESLRHVKGRWAARGERLILQPWQVFPVAAIFGWLRKVDDTRRFRDVYAEVPRKSGKSILAAAVGLYMLTEDGEHGAEVFCGAGTERQALEVFTPAKLMADRSPDYRDSRGLELWAKALVRPEDNSRFWPVVGKPGDGSSPSCAIIDEFHEHQTSDLVDSMVSGMGSRAQPLLFCITTAGVALGSPCRLKHDEAEAVLSGAVENDEFFCIIFTIDEDDDWTTPEAIRKANPNLGASVDEGFLLAQQRQAVQNAAHQNRFRTKHLNEWVSASVAGINMDQWRRAEDKALRIEQFVGEESIFSLDLASKLDICAFVRLFVRQLNGQSHYYAFGRYYLPEDTVAEAASNQGAYQKWIAEGHLIATPGGEIDFDTIRDDVKEARSAVQCKEIVYDPWRATQLGHQLMKDGAATAEFPQGGQHMAAGFDELLAALKSGRFHHDGNPVLAWMAANTRAKSIRKGLVVPAKQSPDSPAKIDGVVALCQAIARANAVEQPKPAPQFQFFRLGPDASARP